MEKLHHLYELERMPHTKIFRLPHLLAVGIVPFGLTHRVVETEHAHLVQGIECRGKIVVLCQPYTELILRVTGSICTLELVAVDCDRDIAHNGIGQHTSLAYGKVNTFLGKCRITVDAIADGTFFATHAAHNLHWDFIGVGQGISVGYAERVVERVLGKVDT